MIAYKPPKNDEINLTMEHWKKLPRSMRWFEMAYGIPTWVFHSLIPLPKDHPWKRQLESLSHWAASRPPLCEKFDFLFWLIILMTLVELLFHLFAPDLFHHHYHH